MSHSENPFERHLSTEEHRFLERLLELLSREAPAGYRDLIRANPQLRRMASVDEVLARVRAALSGQSELPLTAPQRAAAEALRRAAARLCGEPEENASDRGELGVLTSLTRQLSPEKALVLYRKIAPILVYNLLQQLIGSAPLDLVGQVTDRLCGPQAQDRLRCAPHVRDAIVNEVSDAVGCSRIQRRLSRQDVLVLLAASGMMNELLIMENCIKLIHAKAG